VVTEKRSHSNIRLESLKRTKTNMNSMDFASKGLYSATNQNSNAQKYYFMRESVANSDKNLIGTPRSCVKNQQTTMFDPNHMNKFI